MKPEKITLKGQFMLDHDGIFISNQWLGNRLEKWHDHEVKITIKIEEIL